MSSGKEYSSAYLDKSILEDIFMPGDPKSLEGFENFLKIFDESCKSNLVKLSTAVAELNYGDILDVVHNFKGVAGNVGATKLVEICGDLDKSGKKRSVDEIQRLSTLVSEEIRKVLLALNDYGNFLKSRA